MNTAEHQRLSTCTDDIHGWRRWGPYVSERSWGTVREDYSPHGDAWEFLSHDTARSKAYRWGEDAIAGICDRYQVLVFAPAFWNRQDAILKERLYGLTPAEGNHGEDVKEYYFHLDNTPTHSYMRYLYKYPQAAFPYNLLISENRRRNERDPEFELLETGVFDQDRYFDIVIEYAKAGPEDLCIRIEAFNRGPDPAPLDLLPQLWFRNTWGWSNKPGPQPVIKSDSSKGAWVTLCADDTAAGPLSRLAIPYSLGRRFLYASPDAEQLFTNNETNYPRVYGPGAVNRTPDVKDAFHRSIVQGKKKLKPPQMGTKAALHYRFDAVQPGSSVVVRLRLTDQMMNSAPLAAVDSVIAERKAEADEFYASVHPPSASPDERNIQRQALSGLLWNKQSYIFDVQRWLEGDNPDSPPPDTRHNNRNQHWRHLNSLRVMSMPDKWEYPWFAAWDLAFQCVAFAQVDPQFAKEQLWLLLFEQFLHPNGQIPAYEWEFSDLNPPVHAWAVWRVFQLDQQLRGKPDRGFLERCFHKLLINFTWWINKVDRAGNNIFEGGFLGLDNITLIDRSQPFADGAVLEQADATGWMGMMCLNLMRIALELAKENHVYEGLATKFFQHYVYIAAAMKHMGGRGDPLWDERDGFFYDMLRLPDGRVRKFRVRSLVGLIPLFAVERLDLNWLKPFPEFRANMDWFLTNRRDLVDDVVHTVEQGGITWKLLTIVNRDQLSRLLARVCDPKEFLSPFGLRSLSKAHESHPFELDGLEVGYEPAEAKGKIKGGNSNWRGPIWFQTTYLLIESLRKLGQTYGNSFTIPLPDGGKTTCPELATELSNRMIGIFKKNDHGHRPVYGQNRKFQEDSHWRDHLLFYEYFHGDDGSGLGASHQTGWTALVASLLADTRK